MFFFFKQKTAYEMRISDWSSDVCSSDLPGSGRTLMGPDGISIGLLPGDPIVAGQILRGLDHTRDHAIAFDRLRHQSRPDQAVVQFETSHARALTERRGIMLDVRHALGTAGDDDVGSAGLHHQDRKSVV